MGTEQKQARRMKIIVDTNIIFSALVNSNGQIGELLFNSGSLFSFYSCVYMRFEIEKHWGKLLKVSKLSKAELEESKIQALSKDFVCR